MLRSVAYALPNVACCAARAFFTATHITQHHRHHQGTRAQEKNARNMHPGQATDTYALRYICNQSSGGSVKQTTRVHRTHAPICIVYLRVYM